VAWERRGTNLYYYQGEREGSYAMVRKKYIGPSGAEIAEAIAHADETIRRSRAERRARARAEIDEAEGLASMAEEANEAAEVLALSEMLAAGYHKRKGEWRQRRDA
jgi:hypothetical protein